MTGPADHNDDELTAALRRDLHSTYVSFDERRADEMIGRATQVQLLDARHWNAPLAAAAAVVLVGGGAAIVAANVGRGHHTGTAAAGGNVPYVAVCGTAGPLPQDSAVSSATESPSSTSTVVPGVPGVQIPSTAPTASGVRVGPTPTTTFPVVVRPNNGASADAPLPSAVPSPVASPVPTTSGSAGTDPCATPSPAVPQATSVGPTPVESVSPSAALSTTPAAVGPTTSSSATPSYLPPIPPTPTRSGETNAVPIVVTIKSVAGGTTTREIGPIRSDATFVASGLTFRNNAPGTTGTVELHSSGQGTLTVAVQDFNRFEYALHEPFTFTGDDHISLNCTGAAACDATVTLIGNYVAR